jgi:hypothetical protein
MSDAPIDQQDYLYGIKVVQIDDLRVARGLTRRPKTSCRHKRLVYDQGERRVWCEDCETEVEPFDAFMGVVEVWGLASNQIERRKRELAEAEAFAIISRASKVIDQVWRSKRSVPLCPHCHEAILPGDVVGGVSTASRQLVEQRRKTTKTGKPANYKPTQKGNPE